MDAVDIIIMAAAGVGLVAFVVLAVIILRQGRSIRELEDRIGPPVPPAAAPSLERVRALTAGAVAAAPAPEAPAADQPAEPARPPTARAQARARTQAGAAAAGAAAAGGAPAPDRAAGDHEVPPPAPAKRARAPEESSGRGFLVGIAVLLALTIIGLGGWWFFLRGDGSSTPGPSAGTQTTATVGDTGEVPEDIPPLANKAAYTVAVLNASDITGAAANKVAPRVQADGYTLGVVDNATKQDLTKSEVQYVTGRKEVAWNLAEDLGITRAVPVNALAQGRIGTADAVVVVGIDLAK
ncbi:MAG: LytR family transcriptional regulator [Actinobacteria bacterium]|nr:LytR family transcriptional regulator [Actinomycetota bacterium]MBM3697444.1 LytR family transcriptional regulator [Actinomycetota bacterium]